MFGEENWDKYYEAYSNRRERFSVVNEDLPVLRRMYEKLGCIFEKEHEPLSALVLGAAGPRSIHDFSALFWNDISQNNGEDKLTFLDMRGFDEKDKEEANLCENETLLIRANGMQLPFEDGSFNLVLTHCLFECIDDSTLKNIVKELERVTTEKGIGIHTFADCQKSTKRIRRFKSIIRKHKYGISFHYRDLREIEEILNENKFQIIDVGFVGFGLSELENLTVGCFKVSEKRKEKFPFPPFGVER